MNSRVRALDYTAAKKDDVQRRFRDALDEKVDALDAGWESTETALKELAVGVFPSLKAPSLGTWLTPAATAELGSLIKQRSECHRLLSRATPDTVSQLRARNRSSKKAIRLCVEKHKKTYRRYLVSVATSSKDANNRRLA